MILVTGANGLIGSEICKSFGALNVPFKALKRTNADLSLLPDPTIEWVEGDVLDTVGICEIIKENKIEIVVHCAAVVSYFKQDESLMYDVNVKGTMNVVDACIEYQVKQLIHISSIAALGRKTGRSAVYENDNWVESPLNSAYARTKYLSELEVWRGYYEGVNVCVINPSVVIAAGDGHRSSSKLLKYVWDKKLFYTEGKLNYVDARDVVKVVVESYKKQVSGERFILNAGNIEYISLFKQIANKFNITPPRIKVGRNFLKVIYLLDQLKYIVTRIKPVVTKELLKSTKADFLYVNDKSRAFFSMEYRPLNESLEWACTSFKQHKKG